MKYTARGLLIPRSIKAELRIRKSPLYLSDVNNSTSHILADVIIHDSEFSIDISGDFDMIDAIEYCSSIIRFYSHQLAFQRKKFVWYILEEILEHSNGNKIEFGVDSYHVNPPTMDFSHCIAHPIGEFTQNESLPTIRAKKLASLASNNYFEQPILCYSACLYVRELICNMTEFSGVDAQSRWQHMSKKLYIDESVVHSVIQCVEGKNDGSNLGFKVGKSNFIVSITWEIVNRFRDFYYNRNKKFIKIHNIIK